jgi:competence protein ComEA
MPTRTGRTDAAAELATRLAELRLPTGPPAAASVAVPAAAPAAGGWLPEQARPVGGPPTAPAVATPSAVPPPLSALARGWIEDRLPLWAHGRVDRVSRGTVLPVVGLVLVALLGVFVVVHHRSAAAAAYAGSSWPGSSAPEASTQSSSSAAAGSAAPTSPTATGATTDSAASGSIVVDVGGRVRRPGLVTLPPGARVADAIAAAGGALRHRDVATTDLAAKVGDGQLLLIGTTGAASASSPAGGTSAGSTAGGATEAAAPVSLSSADLTTLETLPGVGPVTAQKILDWRTAHNGFTSIEQLQQVPGIGPAHYAAIQALVAP